MLSIAESLDAHFVNKRLVGHKAIANENAAIAHAAEFVQSDQFASFRVVGAAANCLSRGEGRHGMDSATVTREQAGNAAVTAEPTIGELHSLVFVSGAGQSLELESASAQVRS